MHIFSVSIQEMWYISVTFRVCDKPYVSPIRSTSLEMSEVSSETDMLLISLGVPQQTDAAIFIQVL